MRFTTLVVSAALAIPTISVAQADSTIRTQVIQREQDMWRYVQEHKLAPLLAALDTSVYVAVTQHGIHASPVDAARYAWTSLERYQLSDFGTQELEPGLVLLTYKADLRGRSLGNRVAGIYWMSTIWRMKDGAWLAVFHSEVKGG